ncbi:MAG: AIR carboxylase family protein [Nanoarchaeota archaeon]
MNVLVIFGSASDSSDYEPVVRSLKESGVSVELRLLSAHRTPKEVDELPFDSYDAIIAGAGLAAHLPGVVAARAVCPVFGIPCVGAYEGLDSFLSIAQMPPGIPVLATGIGRQTEATNAVLMMQKGLGGISLCYSKKSKAVEKAIEILQQFKVNYDENIAPSSGFVNISFVDEYSDLKTGGITIFCPISDKTSASDALEWFEKSSKGLWVGQNRGENAALAAIQLLGKNKDDLKKYKEGMRLKVLETDQKLRYG